MNCAQSVLSPFNVEEETMKKFSNYGSGHAPDGWCGAASSAAYLIKDSMVVEEHFCKNAGAVTCNEIRKQRRLPCVGCVKLATELVINHSGP